MGVKRHSWAALIGAVLAGAMTVPASSVRAQGFQTVPCVTMPLPAGLDDVDQLVDTAATVSVLRTMPAGEVILSLVGTESHGAPRLSIHTKHGDADADTVQKLIASHLRSTDGTPAPWAVRLNATTGPSGSVTLAAPELCGAHPASLQGLTSGTVRVDGADMNDLVNAGPSTVRVWVSATGSVERTELVQSSGSPKRDEIDTKLARTLRYEPARFEGIPIAGTYDMHVH